MVYTCLSLIKLNQRLCFEMGTTECLIKCWYPTGRKLWQKHRRLLSTLKKNTRLIKSDWKWSAVDLLMLIQLSLSLLSLSLIMLLCNVARPLSHLWLVFLLQLWLSSLYWFMQNMMHIIWCHCLFVCFWDPVILPAVKAKTNIYS